MNFADQVEQEELEQRRAAIESIRTLYGIKEGRRAFEAEEKKARVAIDNFFLGHQDERELRDDELGYVARLQSGGVSMVYEKAHIIHAKAPQLFDRLLELGCLSVDGDKVKDAIKEGLLLPGDVESWRHAVERSSRLLVERRDG